MSTPGSNQLGKKARPNMQSLFSSLLTASGSAKKPTTTNVDNAINPAPRVPGQDRFAPSPTETRGHPAGTVTRNPTEWIGISKSAEAEYDNPNFEAGYTGEPEEAQRTTSKGKGKGKGKAREDAMDLDSDDAGDKSNQTTSDGKRPRKPTHYGAPPLPLGDRKAKRRKTAASEEEEHEDNAFPLSPEGADESDHMLYTTAGQLKRNWKEIEQKWEGINGKKSKFSLTDRFYRIIRGFANRGVLDLPEEVLRSYPCIIGEECLRINAIVRRDKLIARIKEDVDEELESYVWGKIADGYNLATGDGLSAQQLYDAWNDAQCNVPLEARELAQAEDGAGGEEFNQEGEEPSEGGQEPNEGEAADMGRDSQAQLDHNPVLEGSQKKGEPVQLVSYDSDSD
ncbi:hypothetical protein A1O1_00139 [Capronia coronata CBS 617.96]|uniref:Uncharacterized protein n=1 Tax=Capronia coronata CBS 617.96 TaxID=1182541 RepID=W9Z0D1_9EURO|nr:uncharacterized protein A1O1_00139 [Capronia coronata CBS 617.96]EXJ95021.1 hypothetical protein A1O1_00139 [Capronia coronata CBS 617.96]